MANLLNFRAAVGAVAALIASVATSGCGFGLDGKYPPSRYEGVWRIELTSDACGSSDAETTSNADAFGFSVYNNKYRFFFIVSDATVKLPHQGTQTFRNAYTNEIHSRQEMPAINLKFTSHDRAEGTWTGKDCTGTMSMVKLYD